MLSQKWRWLPAPPPLLLQHPLLPNTLYFTTAASPYVQAYSLATGTILPFQPSHPSLLNVIASSSTGDILFSASSAPPTTHLQYHRWGDSVPMYFQPTDALAPVTCAVLAKEGQCDNKHVYIVLRFMDGTDVLCNIHVSATPFRTQPVKMGGTKRLHKPGMRGVKAAEFISDYTSRVISVGLDGRCRLVDLSKASKVYRTWYVEGESHCLAVHKLIAIGTSAGKIEIFNVIGLKVHETYMNVPVIRVW